MILSYVCLLSDPFDCLENNCDCKLAVLEETIWKKVHYAVF